MAARSEVDRPGLFRFLFALSGGVDRVTYARVGFALMVGKYLVDAGLVYARLGAFWTPLDYLNPLLTLRESRLGVESTAGFQLAMALWTLPFLWIGLVLTIRRTWDAGLTAWAGLLFLVPVVNYGVMLGLCLAPTRRVEPEIDLFDPEPPAYGTPPNLAAALQAVVLATVLALLSVALSVYVLGAYGVVLFLVTPFLWGVLAGVLLNRQVQRSAAETAGVAMLTVAIACGALVLFALEGVICIAMVAPLLMALAVAGALLGRGLLVFGGGGIHEGIFALGVLPLLALAEVRWLEPAHHRVTSSVEVDAPPEVVWGHVVRFSELPPPGRLVFRLGIAYPVRARIDGEGVGAVRRCEFSTGAFVEPITDWDPPRRLAFDVLAQPPPMTEWSPYRGVHPPHLDGYFRSTAGEFCLTPLDGGRRTRLEGTTWYTLDLHPTAYWRLWAEALVGRIHGRVLDHVADLAEAEASPR